MKKAQLGDFVKYTKNNKHVEGPYGLVFRLHPDEYEAEDSIEFQVVWFGEKRHCLKYHVDYTKYSISGGNCTGRRTDCKVVSKPPKRILKRAEDALSYIVNAEAKYYERHFTNLDLIEVLARVKKLI